MYGVEVKVVTSVCSIVLDLFLNDPLVKFTCDSSMASFDVRFQNLTVMLGRD